MERIVAFERFRTRFRSREVLYGTMVHEIGMPNVIRLLKRCGFDFVVIDCENGCFSLETVSNVIAASHASGPVPIVRIPEVKREPVQKLLAAGAAGILVPSVVGAKEVRQLIGYAKFAPEGTRGYGTFQPWSEYDPGPPGGLLAAANDATTLIVQIETREAVDCIEEITAIPDVDGFLVGPGDLSLSFGQPGNWRDTAVSGAIDSVLAAAHRHGRPCGIHCAKVEDLEFWRERGMDFVMWSAPVLMIYEAAKAALARLRGGG